MQGIIIFFWIPECVSRPVTDIIKGVFIWLVFSSHFTWGGKISALLGQLVVACFLFNSGYGVCEAIKHRANRYILSFPKNRILKTIEDKLEEYIGQRFLREIPNGGREILPPFAINSDWS